MKNALRIVGIIALTVLPIDGAQTVTINVTPANSLAPAILLIRARIEPSTANRRLMIIADGENFYRSSELPLDGDQSPKNFEFTIKSVPGGEYGVYAVVFDASGHERGRAYQVASVRVPGED